MRSFKHTSLLSKLSWVLLDFATFLTIISFASPSWVESKPGSTIKLVNTGIWRTCYVDQDSNSKEVQCRPTMDYFNSEWMSNWVAGTQAVLTLGLITLFLATALCNMYMFVPQLEREMVVAWSAMCCGFASVAFSFIGVIIYGIKQTNDADFAWTKLAWAYGLHVTATIFVFVAVICLLAECCDVTRGAALSKQAARLQNGRRRRPTNGPVSSRQSCAVGHLTHTAEQVLENGTCNTRNRPSRPDTDSTSVTSLVNNPTYQGDDPIENNKGSEAGSRTHSAISCQ